MGYELLNMWSMLVTLHSLNTPYLARCTEIQNNKFVSSFINVYDHWGSFNNNISLHHMYSYNTIHFTNAVSVNDHKNFLAFRARFCKDAYSRLVSRLEMDTWYISYLLYFKFASFNWHLGLENITLVASAIINFHPCHLYLVSEFTWPEFHTNTIWYSSKSKNSRIPLYSRKT